MNPDCNKKKLEKLIFCILFFAAAYFQQMIDYDNTSSRYFLMSAVVDYGTLNIDAYQERTIDRSFWNGHYYSSKAIGASLIGLPIYWILRNITPLGNGRPLSILEKYIVRILTSTLVFALLGSVLFRVACLMGVSIRMAFWMVLSYSFGSIAFLHATLFSGHQIAASFAFFSFAILFSLAHRKDGDRDSMTIQCDMDHLPLPVRSYPYRWSGTGNLFKIFLAGLFAGIAALADYTAMFIAIVLTVYIFSLRLSWISIVSFLLGGGISIVVLALYNLYCFGSIVSMSYVHQTYSLFAEGAKRGLLGVSFPDPFALLSIMISPSRGLFFIMPVFIFSLTGFSCLLQKPEFRHEAVLIIIVVIGYFFINSGFYGWHGGWTFGPRYLVPMLPFFALPIAFIKGESFWFNLLFGLSVFQIFIPVIGILDVPQEIQNPIVEFIIPLLGYGYMATNAGQWIGITGLWSTIPFFILVVGLVVLTFWVMKANTQKWDISLISKTLITIWISFILLKLAVVRTEVPMLVHYYRAKALYSAASVTRSVRLNRMAIYEKKLAGLK